METLLILHNQVATLINKVLKLTNYVGNIQSTCALRHKEDLLNKINHTLWCISEVEKRILKQLELNSCNNLIHQLMNDTITEIKTILDSIKIRISTLEKETSQKELRKFTIKSQIFITIVGAILLSLITAIGSIVWNHLFNNNHDNDSYRSPKILKNFKHSTLFLLLEKNK